MQCSSCLSLPLSHQKFSSTFHVALISSSASSSHHQPALTSSPLSPSWLTLAQLSAAASSSAVGLQHVAKVGAGHFAPTCNSLIAVLLSLNRLLTQGGCQSHLQHRKCELCVARFELAATCRRFASSAECPLDLSSIKQHAPTLSCCDQPTRHEAFGKISAVDMRQSAKDMHLRRDTRLLERYQSWI